MKEFELHPQLAADCLPVGDLPLCRVLLLNNSDYPWFILVPRRVDISEAYQLSEEDQSQLLKESSMVGRLLMNHFNGDKLNVAALGNVVPQLHLHHIVRYTTDPAWPAPVWGFAPATAYFANELGDTIKLVQAKIAQQSNDFTPAELP